MSHVNSLKAELRKTALSARRAIPDKTRKSELIAERVFCDPDYIAARTVAVYKSLSSEVGTDLIIAHALHSGKRVVLPKVFGDTMDFLRCGRESLCKKAPSASSSLWERRADTLRPGRSIWCWCPVCALTEAATGWALGGGIMTVFCPSPAPKPWGCALMSNYAPRGSSPPTNMM